MPQRLPSLFVSHGAPTLFLEPQPARAFLQRLGATLPRPEAVLCVSAHWTTARPTVTLAAHPETIHDFSGFPEELYAVRYPAPGAPGLAGRVLSLLEEAGVPASGDAARGLDHGAWVPLGLMYPEADVPVVQLSVQPGLSPREHLAVGRALAPLAREGVLVLGSGGATHNLRDVRWDDPDAPPPPYVRAFDDWLKAAVLEGRTEALAAYADQAPYAGRNHPTPEHFLPLFAPLAMGGTARLAHDSFCLGVLSMAAFLWEP
ncbi:class III extradiol ring-cleavage dioxygenase [Solidesulfovibrio sp.]|uniref:DODA-type extradiol aromatic ring-opening family dioxygenase n=1 Tax=Solidesulfovibrio sp. TaxID=2910990 RepID=UPI002610B2F9|nr:class III extradiol ring-cleavage dioxygenase [Solidesulfovibrio sp.]